MDEPIKQALNLGMTYDDIAKLKYVVSYYETTGFWYVVDTDINLAVKIRMTEDAAREAHRQVMDEYIAELKSEQAAA